MSTRHKLEFVYAMAKYSSASISDCERLMRYGATHLRIETELTNGYKTAGKWDEVKTINAKAKRDRIDTKMEALAKSVGVGIEYGALTVRVVFADGREAGIP